MENNIYLESLINKIGLKKSILKIPVKVEPGATLRNCFPNVIEKVNKSGGSIIYGWIIHKTSILYEAERHAIWKSNENELIDITPQEDFSEIIEFIEDNSWEYTGEILDNIRINITGNSVVDDYFVLCETITKLYQTGKRSETGELIMLQPIYESIKTLENLKLKCESFIYSGGNTKSVCFCCNSDSYNKCFGKNVKSDMHMILGFSQYYLNTSFATNS